MKLSQFLIFILALTCPFACTQGQYKIVKDDKINSITFTPIHIDTLTEEVLVIDKRYALVYFRKSDVLKHINRSDSLFKVPTWVGSNFPRTLELLQKEKKPKLIDWWTVYTPKERFEKFGTYTYSNNDALLISEFNGFGNIFIRDGKFMVVDKRTGKEVINELKLKAVKKQNNFIYYENFIYYILPNGKPFWIDEDTWEHWARMGYK